MADFNDITLDVASAVYVGENDYERLINKPAVNGITLDKSTVLTPADIGALGKDDVIQTGEKAPTVYCWGDSLTEGVGGDMATSEGIQRFVFSAYTDVLGGEYSCVNLGCRGETVQTIMARQGSDALLLGGFTIPASADEAVAVGHLKGSYFDADRAGLKTLSGDFAQPLKETEVGINPCTLAGVKGTLYRGYTKDASGRYTYYFKRETSGAAVAVPGDTPLVTYADTHYKGGICVLWCGANGAVNSHTEYISRLKKFIAHGAYENYVIVLAREYAPQWVGDIKAAFTDENGACHVLYLPPLLISSGYTLAGVASSAGVPDTSNWGSTYGVTDEILLKAPLLCAVNASLPCGYEALHFSPYGYKAIGKLIAAKLGELLGTSDVADDGYETNVKDSFGSLAFRLTRPKTGTGELFDTGYMPYDTDKNWTICCKFADSMTAVNGSLGSVFEAYEFFADKGRTTAVYLRLMPSQSGMQYGMAGGFGGFNMPSDQFTPSTDGWHYAIISKNGDNFDFYFDGGHAYNCALGYAIDGNYSPKTLKLFGRVWDDGVTVGEITSGTVADFRIYSQSFDVTACTAIYNNMKEV